MRNRLILVFLFGALLLAGAVRVPSAANGASAAARARPNVLFIVMDDLRASIGAYGDATAITPNIDRLARRSLLFTHAYAQQAVCNPSRQSFLSGRRPDSIHVWNLTSHFRQTAPDVVSLPEYFKGQGYVSQGIGKIYHDPAEMQDPQSWSVPATFNVLAKKEDYVLPENQAPPDKPGKKMAASEGADAPDNAYPDGRVADAAVAALGQLKAGGKPFFLAVGFRKPHLPFSSPKKYWDLYDRAKIPPPERDAPPTGAPGIAHHDWPELRGYADIAKQGPLTREKTQELRHGYYAGASYTDAQVGRVLDELDRLKLGENTVIVFFSDHGFHLGELGLWCKDTVYEATTRVPLMIAAPRGGAGSAAGRRSEAPVELIDLYPTLMELCGLPRPAKLEGRSLVPLLKNPGRPWKAVAYSQFPRPWAAGSSDPPRWMGYAVRTDRFRYIEWRDFKTGELSSRELYDYSKGLLETANLADDPAHAAQVTELSRLLKKGFMTLSSRSDSAQRPQLPDLPRPSGGQMAGVSGDALLVVGGSYFQGSIFEGGRKVWLDTVLALEPGGGAWKVAGRLDHPLGYGAAVNVDGDMVVVGGSDGARNYAEVRRLRWREGKLEVADLPALPRPLANIGAAAIGRTIYVAGGQAAPDSTEASKALFALDLGARSPEWKALDPIPGAGRILPVVAAQGGALFVISGAELLSDAGGKAARRYLKDGWRYAPGPAAGKNWSRIADAPRPVVAAPVTEAGEQRVLVFGGDDGADAARVFELKDNHPGFSREILAYDPAADRWSKAGELPVSLVTTQAVKWRSEVIIPGGEDRPGHRSARALAPAVSPPR
jgi:arylsulfatase A-like enzyme/N-acetylneuraminic acid mutarotase